jgi:UDP-N-acetylglucosamine 3-dehydrogenase
VNVAVIGAGAIARRFHIPCYKNNEAVNVQAVVDINPKRAKSIAKKFKIENWFCSLEELLESKLQLDAISICTPPKFHADIAIRILKNQINVLCEKPLAEDVASGQRILDVARNSKALFMMGFNRRFIHNYALAKQRINQGALGRIYSVEYKSLQASPVVGWSKSDWFYSESEGGCLKDQGPHVFDILNWFLGKPKSVSAKRVINLNSDVDESCFATVTYTTGAVGLAMMSWMSPSKIEELELMGTGTNIIASPEMFLELSGGSINEVELFRAVSPMYVRKIKNIMGMHKPSTFQLEIDYFVDCIKRNRKPTPTIQDGLNALVLTEKAVKSIQDDRDIPVN